MPSTVFPREVYLGRQARAFEAIRATGLETFIALHPVTLHWLTGLDAKSYQSFQCALLDSRNDSLVLYTRAGEHAEITDHAIYGELLGWSAFRGDDPIAGLAAILKARDLGGGCGVEVVPWYLTPAQHQAIQQILGARFVHMPDLVNDLRLVRSVEELDCLRQAGRIADAAIAAFSEALREGRRGCDLASVIYQTILGQGGDAPPVPLNLCGGPRGGYPHGAPTDRLLRHGESGNAEFAVPWKRYTVSIGRSYVLGQAPARLSAMYDAVLRAQASMLSVLRSGVTISEVFDAGMDVFRAVKLDHLVAHTIGYSVAPAFPPATGERLSLSAQGTQRLEAGMTLSIAPNLFSAEEHLGVRLVNNVIVQDDGCERLTHGSDALIVKC